LKGSLRKRQALNENLFKELGGDLTRARTNDLNRWSKQNGREHEICKVVTAMDLIREDHIVLLEAEMTYQGTRRVADILDFYPEIPRVYEIQHSETELSIEHKRKFWVDKVGFDYTVIKV